MPSRNRIIPFFVLAFVINGVLLIPWPGLASGYRSLVCATGNLFFRRIGEAFISFEPMKEVSLEKDIEITLNNPVRGKGKMSLSARRMYLPTAFVASLILAAPIPWRRKVIALFVGLALFNVYLWFTVWLKLIYGLSEPRGLDVITLAPSLRKFVLILITILSKSPVTAYIVSLLVFVVSTLRKEDLTRPVSATGSQPSSAKSNKP